jgi:hypothetical protein
MTLYHVHVRIQSSPLAQCFSRELTAEALSRAIGDILVRRFNQYSDQGDQSYGAELLLRRPTAHDALTDIRSVIAQLGFAVGEAVTVEYASAVTESAVTGFIGGGAFGVKTRSPLVAIVAAGAGAAAGAALGNLIHIEKARYQACWDVYTGSWQLVQVPVPKRPQVLFVYAPPAMS